MTFLKYPSTPSFKDAFTLVKRSCGKPKFLYLDEQNQPVFAPVTLPVITFLGTVKVHGTHGDVHRVNGELIVQSRNRVLDLNSDNCGFYAFVMANEKQFHYMLDTLRQQGKPEFLSGEFAGSNIQHGVAVTGMPKTFLVFNEGVYPYLNELETERNIYNIAEFDTFSVSIDFNNPTPALEEIDKLVEQVELLCPVGAILNPTRTFDVGEGIVWKAYISGYEEPLMFKSKGTKHARVAKVKVPMNMADNSTINEFVALTVTGDRLEQGIEFLKEMGKPLDKSSTGAYIGWVSGDVFKESASILTELGLVDNWKQVAASINAVAKEYFFNRLETNLNE